MAKSAAAVKRDRFKTVASRRVQRVLDSMDNLAKCANRSTYEYTEEEVRKMMKAVNDKVALLKASFTAGSKPGKETFEF